MMGLLPGQMASWVMKDRWHRCYWSLVKPPGVSTWKEASGQLVPTDGMTESQFKKKMFSFLCCSTSLNSKYRKIRIQLVCRKVACFLFLSLLYIEKWQVHRIVALRQDTHPRRVMFSIKFENMFGWNSSYSWATGLYDGKVLKWDKGLIFHVWRDEYSGKTSLICLDMQKHPITEYSRQNNLRAQITFSA